MPADLDAPPTRWGVRVPETNAVVLCASEADALELAGAREGAVAVGDGGSGWAEVPRG